MTSAAAVGRRSAGGLRMKTLLAAATWPAALLLAGGLLQGPAAAAEDGSDFAAFLGLRDIDLSRRTAVTAATEWNEQVEAEVVKILQRLDAPESLWAGWRKTAAALPAAGEPIAPADTLLAVRGRATFVAARRLPAALTERFGRPQYDVVRIVDERGMVVDVLTRSAPAAWPRWQPIDQPTVALGLPLATTAAPRPQPPAAGGQEWPAGPPDLVLGAAGVGWYPDTFLGRLGMDYGLFDTVVDGKKLVAGDAAAFYALLGAAGRTERREIAEAADGLTDVMLLIDPGRKWFPAHRGDPLVIDGTAMRATRVSIDEPHLRESVGSNHYWELFVFVETPLLEVDGRRQTSFPIVCCVRDLPPGMPVGERINERVRVAGFGLKRYAYPFDDPRPAEAGRAGDEPSRRQTTLLVGPRPAWVRPPDESATQPIWLIAAVAAGLAVAAILGLGLIYGNWSLGRTIRKAREELPDRVELPPADDAADRSGDPDHHP
jgi:hypothetical protein